MTKVAILGCGPAGLLSAHAAALLGCQVHVYSKPVKSPLGGAQYVQESIPVITDEPHAYARYVKLGTAREYTDKVYGPEVTEAHWWGVWPPHDMPAWSLQAVYDTLWEQYEDDIRPVNAGPGIVSTLSRQYDAIVCTIPRQVLCWDGRHNYPSQSVWLKDELPHDVDLPDNTILYSGLPGQHWYRCSTIFGYSSTETTVPRADWRNGFKPVDTTCDCHTDNPKVLFAGRFGQWKRGVLMHHAFEHTYEFLQNMRGISTPRIPVAAVEEV
jgi:hypothetical protein